MAEQNFPLKVNLIGNSTSLNTALAGASSRLKAFGKNVSSIGRSLSTSLTLPLGIAAGASIKMALDFDKSMTKIKTLVGVAADEVDAMSSAVKQLAVDTGVSSNAAADALFFITSAGLRGSDALKVLEASSKASAIGLGEVKTVADAVTSAVNAYGIENLTAERATDVLTAAVREGKLESDSLAQSMGKVLPVASQLGVGFEEVGAALAAMSRTGTDAAMASTSLRGILSALLNPSKQAKDELEKFGLSAQGLREQLKDEGLLSVLSTLVNTFGDNEEAAGKVFGNIRALTGVLDLMGKNVESTEEIFNALKDTTNTLNDAFIESNNSIERKFNKQIQALKTSFTELGTTLAVAILPAFKKVTDGLTGVINKFNNLDTATQNIILSIGGIALALGPALIVIGSLATAIGTLINPITIVIAAIAGIGLAIDNLVMPLDEFLLKAKATFDKINVYARQTSRLLLSALSFGFGESIDDILTETKLSILDINTRLENDLGQLDGSTITEKITEYFKGLREKFSSLGTSLGTNISEGIGKGVQFTGAALESAFENVATVAMSATTSWEELNKKIDESNSKIAEFDAKFADTVNNTSTQTMALQAVMNAFAMQIAKAFEGGTASIGQFAAQVVSIIGDLLIQLGTFAIIGSNLMSEALIPIVGAAAGLAAIAVGAAMKGLASKFMSEGVQPFAMGGIVSGPTLGLIGEYAGARHNPEVVAPLNKLKSMIGDRGSANMTGEFVVRGQDLVLALQRAERNRNRFK